MLKVKIVQKKSPKDGSVKYYVQKVPVESSQTLAKISKGIEKTSTVSSADVKAVLDALQTEIIAALQDGKSVRLGDLGSFHVTIKSKGVTDKAIAKSGYIDNIKRVSVQFTPASAIRKAFALGEAREVEFKLDDTADTSADTSADSSDE